MKKLLSILMTVIMCVTLFTACGKEESEPLATEYAGILTKVKLGMPLTKIISLQNDGVELYYEDDVTIWSMNEDTDLYVDTSAIIPAEDPIFYTGNSIITYKFRTVKGDEEIYLNGFTEEVHCLIERTAAEDYFNKKTEQLVNKHCAGEGATVNGSMTGTEDIDMELVYTQNLSASSYDVIFSMTLTYDTVNGVEGYYATKYEIQFIEKAVKNPVAIDSPEVSSAEE
ncbi:MAG: hypothetical protein IJF18_05665 [Oscillospiraceae bacterium]|nr:hypothetical protein [Oscillospiraceae bacterium]